MQKKQMGIKDETPVVAVKDIRLEWNEETRPLHALKDNPRNPRHIKDDRFELLVNSLKKNGYHQRILIDLHNMILGGHQRKKALLEAGWSKEDIIKVLAPNRELTEQEVNALTISDNGAFGSFDMDMLANEYDIGDLIEWGVHPCAFDVDASLGMEEDKPKKEPKPIECPECGHKWVKE